MPAVDLNLDLGELPDEPKELYALATVINVACGGHAGELASMARALSFAMARATRVAAHPSYPDREGFGRVSLAGRLAPAEVARCVEEQCAALQRIARRFGYPVALVKPHGALYHDAAQEPALAEAVLDGALRGLEAGTLTVVGPPEGALLAACQRRGLAYAREGFADRAYAAGGGLVPRSQPGALLTDPEACVRQALALARSGRVETVCVHGDTPGAVEVARAVRAGLADAGLLAFA